ncbi:putative tail fiber protein [Geobacillus phage vB_GthS_PK3.6]|nr:putative tail fiber protein [Geobacillus phage vB_GthS_PK3.6]
MEMMIHVLDGKTEQIVATLENKNGYQALFWDDRHIEKEENNYNTYEFTTIDDGNNPAAEYLTVKNKIVIRDLDGYFIPFTIEETEQDSSGGQRVKRIYAEGEHMELRTAKIIEPIELTGATLNTALDFVLYNTRWTRGITEFAGSRTIKTTEYTTALAFLNKIASEFNVQLRFRVEIDGNKIVGRYVDALLIEDVFDGKEITFGKDVIGIRRIENSGEIYTALYAIGPADENGKYVTIESVNAGLKYVEDREALERWSPDGRHLYGIFQYQPESDEKVTPELLKQKAQEALKNYINSVVKYEVQAVALERIAGLEHEKIRKGMTVRIKDEKFNPPLYLEARVLETERSYTAKDRDTFVLGNYREIEVVKDPTIAKIQSKLFRNENAWSSSARVIRSATPPEDKHAIWIDITKNPEVPMTYDFTTNEWKKASPTVAEEIGAETPTGAQQKAETAKQEAIEHADQAASTAEQNAKQYAEQYTQQYAEQKAPSTTPAAPANFSATGSFKKVILTWDIDTSKVVAYYELYASQTAGFTPSSTNLIYKGKTSGFTHDVDVNQTWYYRLRAVNAYGQAGAFTNEVSASTVKIISDDILFGAVNAQHIADLAVTASKLADGSITTPKITDGAVNTAKIVDDAITNAKIATGAVGNAELDRSSANKIQIATNDIIDGAVSTLKIAASAVNSTRLADLAVTAAKIADGNVTSGKIADAAITSTKIANAAVGAAAIANAAIGTAHIADAAITNAKIANVDASKITTGTLDADRIGANTITANKLVISDFTNLCENPDFENDTVGSVPKGFGSSYARVVDISGFTNGNGSNKALEIDARNGGNSDVYSSAIFPVRPGQKFFVEAEGCYLNTAGTGTLRIGFRRYDDKKTALNYWDVVVQWDGTKTTTFTKKSGVYTVPSSAGYLQIWITFTNNGETTNKAYIDNIRVHRMANSELIVDGSVTADKIAANAITAGSAIIADGAITSAKIADAAITSAKIASAAVGNAAIQNGAITNAKIATAAVGTAQIQDGAITNAKIANLAVDNAKIANLHGSKITAGTVTADKLNVTSLSAISANLGTVTAGTISGVTINGSTINSNLDSNNYLTINNSRIKVRGSYYDNVFTMNGYSGLDFSDGKFKVEFGSLNNSFKGVMETDIVGVKIYDPSQPNVGVFISSSGEAIGFSDYFDGPNAKGAIYTDEDGIVIEGVEQVRTWRGWIAPTLLNGWSNFGSGYEGAAYYKDALGFIRLKGVIKGGTMGAAAFVLPIGYRPPARKMFAVATSGGMGRVDIDTSGNVIIVVFGSASNGYVNLDGIVFNT